MNAVKQVKFALAASKENIMQQVHAHFLKLISGFCLALITSLAFGGGGQSGTGRFCGEITDFGSVFVNGVEYSTVGANIIVNGIANQPQSALRLGMAVRVEGTINPDGITGSATLIEFLGDIEGAIDAAPVINGTRGSFTIYGLPMKTDARTRYDNVANLAALQAGDIVEVSGFFNADDGSYTATRIEKQAVFRKIELRGFISNVTATTFVLGPSLLVNYSSAQLRDLPTGLANGMYIEVKAVTPPVAGTLTATRVNGENSILLSTDLPLGEVQGVAAAVTANGFAMGNQAIAINAQTVFDAAPAAALLPGVKAVAAGPVVGGVLTATVVTIPLALVQVMSRKTHGTAGTFDLPITATADINGAVTVEPRNIGSGHTIVFQFNAPVTSVTGLTSKDASGLVDVGTASFTLPPSPSSLLFVSLTGVADNRRVMLTLTGVNGTTNVAAPIGFLVGDVNNSRAVNSSDISGVKARSGQIADTLNFMFDLNTSGAVNSSDISAVKARSGSTLAP